MAEVGGELMKRTLDEFARACEVLLGDEQLKPMPNNALIGVLCDGVRLVREARDYPSRLAEAEERIGREATQICNIADTLRSRGFTGRQPLDERVIAMAQALDAATAQLAAKDEGIEAAFMAALEAVDAEEELEGEMPAHMREAFLRSPERTLRATVRATKAGIRTRIERLAQRHQEQEKL